MSWVLVKSEGTPAGSPLQTQLMMGGGGGMGGGMFLIPEKPITPEEAGMEATNQYLSRRRGFSPQQRQRAAGIASNAARLAGRYGGLAAMLGAGVKNLYDQSATGEPIGLTNLATSMYGAQQFARPIATRAGAQAGARVGVRGVRQEARDAREAQRTGSPASADFSMPQGTDMSMFDMAPPTQYDSTQTSPLAQAGLANMNPSMMSGESRPYGGYGAPSMSMGDFRQVMPSFSPTQPPASTPAPPTPAEGGGGMSSRLSSALPDPIQASMDQMKENQEKRKEEKKEMEQQQLQSLQDNLRGNSLGPGV